MAQPLRRPARSASDDSYPAKATITTILPAPQQLRAQAGAPGLAVATIRLSAGGAQLTHRVSTEDLERGLLIGRYERCQLAGDDRSLSRVHLLVIRDDDGVWAVDTASRNGTFLSGRLVTAVQLDKQLELMLAQAMALSWAPDQHAQA
jgi:hypothetical protein